MGIRKAGTQQAASAWSKRGNLLGRPILAGHAIGATRALALERLLGEQPHVHIRSNIFGAVTMPSDHNVIPAIGATVCTALATKQTHDADSSLDDE